MVSTEDRRSALLDAAVAEIARSGTRGLRVEAVAKRAGVSTALIYHHFTDRSTLLHGALEHIGIRADKFTMPRAGSGREMVIEMLLSEIHDDDEVRVNAAAWGELRGEAIFDVSLRRLTAGLTQRWADDVATHVRSGYADGSIRTERSTASRCADESRADELGVQLTTVVEGISARWLTGQVTTARARDHLRTIIDALLGPRP